MWTVTLTHSLSPGDLQAYSYRLYSHHHRLTVATKASSVTRSLKLRHVNHAVITWMGDHQGRLGAVNLGPFVDIDLNFWLPVNTAVIVLTPEEVTQDSHRERCIVVHSARRIVKVLKSPVVMDYRHPSYFPPHNTRGPIRCNCIIIEDCFIVTCKSPALTHSVMALYTIGPCTYG